MFFTFENDYSNEPIELIRTEDGLYIAEDINEANAFYKPNNGKKKDLVFVYIHYEKEFNDGCYFKCNRGNQQIKNIIPLRIQLGRADYMEHNKHSSNREGPLNKDEKDSLINILIRPALDNGKRTERIVWQELCLFYENAVKDTPRLYKFIIDWRDLNNMPDYRKLPFWR